MRNSVLDEAQARIKTARRNINNLRYANDITFMAGNEEELNIFWINVKLDTDFGKVMHTLLYLKWITNKNLLCSTWNSAQCYVAAWMGGCLGVCSSSHQEVGSLCLSS